MMPTKNFDNGQNIDRRHTKMSENFSSDHQKISAKLDESGKIDTINFYGNKNQPTQNQINKEDLNIDYDHMYANNLENGEVESTDVNCQNTESEVKFWKEWLILHLDLIQQQSDEILDKERTILILQQENEMLKERISCMERGAPYQPSKFYNNHSAPYLNENSIIEDTMTQDSSVCEEDSKNCVDFIDIKCENGQRNCSKNLKLISKFEDTHNHNSVSDTESQTEPNTEVSHNYLQQHYEEDSQKLIKLETNTDIKHLNISFNLNDSERHINKSSDKDASENFDFTINSSTSSADLDPMRNLRMSIRRKRLSNSSALSNNDIMLEEKRPFRRFKKRRKRVVKDSQLLTTTEQYVTQAGESNLIAFVKATEVPVEFPNSTLEVPRWRVKVYASCYTMEGTENLDDEVYNKRHSRLEHDERRRKRWDVQRIREQRVIEKLKQRQERAAAAGSKTDDQNELQSLWPRVEDIKYLEVSEQLPISAFGCPVPKITPSEFALPWLTNPNLVITKKVPSKKSTARRKRR